MDSTIITPREKRQNDTSALITECEVFYAFSDKQFIEGKAKLNRKEGERLTSIGMGGFMPSENKDKFLQGLDRIALDFKQAMQDEKARTAHILYELYNHEAFYVNDIDSTLDALGEDFTREEVLTVFNKERTKCAYGSVDAAFCITHHETH